MAILPFPTSSNARAFVLPRDVNSVILENLTALAGPSTGALLDTIETTNRANDARIVLTVD